MFLAQTNEIYLNKDKYLGKSIKIEDMQLKEEYGGTEYCCVCRNGSGY